METHAAAGPGNHWFYLLAEGSNPTNGQPTSTTCNGSTGLVGIGIQTAGKIFYNAMLAKTSGMTYVKYRTPDPERRQEPHPRQLHQLQQGQGSLGRRQRSRADR